MAKNHRVRLILLAVISQLIYADVTLDISLKQTLIPSSSLYDRQIKCEYYKHQASNFCRYNYSDYDKRVDCSIVYKQRWCECMGEQKDCYTAQVFY
jgi:hypothetical protein